MPSTWSALSMTRTAPMRWSASFRAISGTVAVGSMVMTALPLCLRMAAIVMVVLLGFAQTRDGRSETRVAGGEARINGLLGCHARPTYAPWFIHFNKSVCGAALIALDNVMLSLS